MAIPRFRRYLPVVFGLFVGLTGSLQAAWKPRWLPVPPEELAEMKSTIDPDAKAEIVFRELEVDDTDFPRWRRETDYIRYKIYETEGAPYITRIADLSNDSGTDLKLAARLTLADGTMREFGRETAQQRDLVTTADHSWLERLLGGSTARLKEHFLAIPGIERGAILEVQLMRLTPRTFSGADIVGWVLQRENLPIRRMSIKLLQPDRDDLERRVLLFNTNTGDFQLKPGPDSKSRIVEARNVGARIAEPLSGSIYDAAPTAFLAYQGTDFQLGVRTRDVTIDPAKNGDWATWATIWALYDEAITKEASKKFRALAADWTRSATTPLDKARQIHDRVSTLYRDFQEGVKRRKPNARPWRNSSGGVSLNDMLDFLDRPAEADLNNSHFLLLSLILNQSAGLPCKRILVPDRRLLRFSPKMTSPAFLHDYAVAIQIGDHWLVSDPTAQPSLPFGVLPWYAQGDAGLLAQEGPQTFIPLPASPARDSVITTSGSLTVDEDGRLHGELRREISGQPAFNLRQQLTHETPEVRKEKLREQIAAELPGAQVTVKSLDGFDAVASSFAVVFEIDHPGYAVMTKDRLILRPGLLHANDSSPFSRPTRQHTVQFPYAWGQIDDVIVTLPANYMADAALRGPAPILEKGAIFNRTQLAFDPAKNALRVRREFVISRLDWPVDLYPKLKGWFDTMATNDQLEYSFQRTKS